MEQPNIVRLKMDFAKNLEHNIEKLKVMHPVDMMKQIEKVNRIVKDFIIPWKAKPMYGKNAFSNVSWNALFYDVEIVFGEWSHRFNKNLRGVIKLYTDIPKKNELDNELLAKYRYTYALWWNTFHLFDEVYKKRSILTKKSTEKYILNGRKTLIDLINGTVDISKVSDQFQKVIDRVNQDDYAFSIIKNKEDK